MTKSSVSYRNSRFNGLKFGIHCEGVLPCRGPNHCPHRYCNADSALPLEGCACPHEREIAYLLEDEFRERWDLLTITPDVGDFEALVGEWVTIHLQRGRAMTRLNRSWESADSTARRKAPKEVDLADLYLDRLARREARLMSELEAGMQRMRDRYERLRPNLQVIELFVAGKKAAYEASWRPSEPLWDEFIDGEENSRSDFESSVTALTSKQVS